MRKPLSRRQLKGLQKSFQERDERRRRQALQAERSQPLVAQMSANLDLLVIVASLASPALRPGLVDRLLVLAELEELKPLVVLTKLDLVEDPALYRPFRALYGGLGYPVVLTSSATGEGLDELRSAVRGQRLAFCGHSGVGKSSLLRCLAPDSPAEVGEVSSVTGKGCHTTTRARLWRLPCGAMLWDLPGLREVPLPDDPEVLTECFPDFRAAARRCRFSDCRHLEDPHCGVWRAVQEGLVEGERYRSYLRILAG